jgi:1-phosphatidylinositol-4-phosphate 5-kinase
VGRHDPTASADLSVEDFNHVEKLTFPAAGSNKPSNVTPPHSLAHTFKFKSYSLKVFRRIRDFFGIDNGEYMLSVCGEPINKSMKQSP